MEAPCSVRERRRLLFRVQKLQVPAPNFIHTALFILNQSNFVILVDPFLEISGAFLMDWDDTLLCIINRIDGSFPYHWFLGSFAVNEKAPDDNEWLTYV